MADRKQEAPTSKSKQESRWESEGGTPAGVRKEKVESREFKPDEETLSSRTKQPDSCCGGMIDEG